MQIQSESLMSDGGSLCLVVDKKKKQFKTSAVHSRHTHTKLTCIKIIQEHLSYKQCVVEQTSGQLQWPIRPPTLLKQAQNLLPVRTDVTGPAADGSNE